MMHKLSRYASQSRPYLMHNLPSYASHFKHFLTHKPNFYASPLPSLPLVSCLLPIRAKSFMLSANTIPLSLTRPDTPASDPS